MLHAWCMPGGTPLAHAHHQHLMDTHEHIKAQVQRMAEYFLANDDLDGFCSDLSLVLELGLRDAERISDYMEELEELDAEDAAA